MSTIELVKNSILIKDLTHYVNTFPRPFQLQALRFYSRLSTSQGKYLILWEIYPEIKGCPYLCFFFDSQSSQAALSFESQKPDSSWELKTHPLGLYIKSNLLGKKCQSLQSTSDESTFSFSTFGEITLKLAPGGLLIQVAVPGKKLFQKHILLESWTQNSAQSEAPISPANAGASSKKWLKLKANVEGDLENAMEWLSRLKILIEKLTLSPSAWGDASHFLATELEVFNQMHAQKELPKFESSTRAEALEKIFRQRRRMERKVKLATERLAQVEAEQHLPQRKIAQSVQRPKTQAQASVGVCVEPMEGLKVWIGKSARDNDELFKKFRDRDLWFHVRGSPGAHVWIPRGQKAFPKKQEPSEEIILLGCQIALLNSKQRASAKGEVDVSERRHLKKGRAPGEVLVLQSKVRQVRVNKDLEQKLFPKKL